MTLLITQGLPGSGKTTLARRWQAEAPEYRILTDRDDLREMLYGMVVHPLVRWKEELVTQVQHHIILDAFARGLSVAVADTNLRDERLEPLLDLAAQWHQPVQYIDLRSTPLGVCIGRDQGRRARGERWVGADVIMSMAITYGLPLEVPHEVS